MAVETGSVREPDRAVGDFVRGHPTSFGCLQISQKVIDDVNRFTHHNFTRQDAFDRATAVKICLAYLAHYGTAEWLNREPTTEDLARIWNGGPNGPWKVSTNDYWALVKAQLDSYAGVWDATYTTFTPARLRIDDEPTQRDRPTKPATKGLLPNQLSSRATGLRAGGIFSP